MHVSTASMDSTDYNMHGNTPPEYILAISITRYFLSHEFRILALQHLLTHIVAHNVLIMLIITKISISIFVSGLHSCYN